MSKQYKPRAFFLNDDWDNNTILALHCRTKEQARNAMQNEIDSSDEYEDFIDIFDIKEIR